MLKKSQDDLSHPCSEISQTLSSAYRKEFSRIWRGGQQPGASVTSFEKSYRHRGGRLKQLFQIKDGAIGRAALTKPVEEVSEASEIQRFSRNLVKRVMSLNPTLSIFAVPLNTFNQQATGAGTLNFVGRDIGRKEVDFREKGQGEFNALVIIIVVVFAGVAFWRMNARHRVHESKRKPKSDAPVL